MKSFSWLVLAAIVALAVVGWMVAGDPGQPAVTRTVAATNSPIAPIRVADVAAPAVTEPIVEPALLNTPEALAWREQTQFRERARRFFHEAASLDAATQAQEAHAIEASVNRYEASGVLSAPEALTLRLGLIQASGASETVRAERSAEVIARYRTESDRRQAAWENQQRNDPGFADYKMREREIVAEVMAMAEIPNGLSRDEYLRQRLLQERVAIAQAQRR